MIDIQFSDLLKQILDGDENAWHQWQKLEWHKTTLNEKNFIYRVIDNELKKNPKAPYPLTLFAWMHEKGIGIEKNLEKSLDYYAKASTRGSTMAAVALSSHYLKANPTDYKQAVYFLSQAIAKNSLLAEKIYSQNTKILPFFYEKIRSYIEHPIADSTKKMVEIS